MGVSNSNLIMIHNCIRKTILSGNDMSTFSTSISMDVLQFIHIAMRNLFFYYLFTRKIELIFPNTSYTVSYKCYTFIILFIVILNCNQCDYGLR